jgi:HEPN domain-containing protein
MSANEQGALFSQLEDIDLAKMLLADLHDDFAGKVARFHQLADLSTALGSNGTLIPGGETAFRAWIEARSSFVQGNYVATVMLCQGLAEHVLAADLALALNGDELPKRVSFRETLQRCLSQGSITKLLADDLERLMSLRNPLSHYRGLDDASNLSRRAIDSRTPAVEHLIDDATFAISVAVRLLALPVFRLDG